MEYEQKDKLQGKPESEENFRFLSSFAQDAIIQINDRGLIIYWNKSAEKLFGLAEAEILNKSLHLLFAPERYLEAQKKDFAKFRSSGEGGAIGKTLELEGKRKNGKEFPIELSLSSFQVNGEWNAVGIIRDISERKKLEAKLKDSETKHRDMINNLDVAFYQVLLGGKLLNHNPAYNFILGYEPSLNLKNTNVKLLWENPELREVYLKQLLKDGYVKNYICHALEKDGAKVVSEKFVLEQKLIESEDTYHSLFNNSLSGIAFHKIIYTPNKEPINYMITDVNPNFEKILHLEKEHVINKLATEVYGVEEPPYFEVYLNVAETMKSESFSVYFEPMDKYFKISAFSFEKGTFVTVFEDITERKKSERLKEKFTEHLEREIKYRTKDLKDLLEKQRLYLDQIEKSSRFKTEFLATMSHELRTPLNAIIGFTDLLLEGVFGQLNKEQIEYIKDIDDSSKHLLDMITLILDISKIEYGQATLKIEEIQLNNIIDQVISTLKPLYLEKDIKWELAGLKKEQFIFADRIQFKQIIYNLLSNAIKFTKKGKIIFEFKENEKDWEFAVKDTGIGISEKDFDIIFKDFKRVKSVYVDATQGTGLGLALTKRLINIHGGDISFRSKLEKGTTFSFFLPKTLKKKSTNIDKVESFLKKL